MTLTFRLATKLTDFLILLFDFREADPKRWILCGFGDHLGHRMIRRINPHFAFVQELASGTWLYLQNE